MRTTLPRRTAIPIASLVWVVVVPLFHAAIPWALSTLTTRFGWARGVPGAWNTVGLVPIALATVGLLWVLVLHLAQTPETVRIQWTPEYLLRRGPYLFTRNPMYLAEVTLWLGWTVWFGSIPVLVGAVLLWAMIQFGVLPREERLLEARFGEPYREYQKQVPRWLA